MTLGTVELARAREAAQAIHLNYAQAAATERAQILMSTECGDINTAPLSCLKNGQPFWDLS